MCLSRRPRRPVISPLRVLLIGASEAQDYWIRSAIRESGLSYELTSFPSAIAALDGWEPVSTTVDVLFVNIKLPLLDIAEAVTSLKQLPGLSAAQVVVYVVDRSEFAAVPLGCQAVLVPGDPQEIVTLLRGSGTNAVEG